MTAQVIPKLNLAILPTPFYRLDRMSGYVDGVDLYIKRDDMTGLGLGGNKIRKLEYVLADAKKKGASVVLTTGGLQSNHCMLTAMAASRVGLDCILVLRGKEPAQLTGNLILSNLVCEIMFIDTNEQKVVNEAMADKAKALKDSGVEPYIIPIGASVPLGALGYYDAYNELIAQAGDLEVKPTHIVLSWGSGGTHAGLLAGACVSQENVKIVGINVDDKESVTEVKEGTSAIANEALSMLGHTNKLSNDDVIVINDFCGEHGYGIPSTAGLRAIKTFASYEGIILDPIYTGKGMAGLLSLLKDGYFPRGSKVVFLHTGGYGAIFAFQDSFASIGAH